MSSPFDLRVYTSMPLYVIAVGIKNDVSVNGVGAYWNLVTATMNGASFWLSVDKDIVADEPRTFKSQGLIEIKFMTDLLAREWVAEVKSNQLVETIHTATVPGAELLPNPKPAQARVCCFSFENELHKGDCKDYITGRGVVNSFPLTDDGLKKMQPPVAKAEPGANLCSLCWNHYYGTGTGRPCGDCKP